MSGVWRCINWNGENFQPNVCGMKIVNAAQLFPPMSSSLQLCPSLALTSSCYLLVNLSIQGIASSSLALNFTLQVMNVMLMALPHIINTGAWLQIDAIPSSRVIQRFHTYSSVAESLTSMCFTTTSIFRIKEDTFSWVVLFIPVTVALKGISY